MSDAQRVKRLEEIIDKLKAELEDMRTRARLPDISKEVLIAKDYEITALKEENKELQEKYDTCFHFRQVTKERLALAVETIRTVKNRMCTRNVQADKDEAELIVSICRETLAKLGEKMEGKKE